MKFGLTQRQAMCLEFIGTFCEENGFSPSFQEMCNATGVTSKGEMHRIITSLEVRGHIRRIPYSSRSILLVNHEGG